MGPLVVSTLRLYGLYATLYVRSDCACRNSFACSLCCSIIDDRHRCRHFRKISIRLERRPRGLAFANVARCAASKAQNPDFNKFVISATTNSKSKGQQRRFHPERARVKIIRSETNDFHKIVNMVPVYLPPDVRDDIAQSILVALLEGALQRDQVKVRVQQFVTAHNREANKHGTGKYGLRSIDAPAFVDSSTTFGDTISRGLWD